MATDLRAEPLSLTGDWEYQGGSGQAGRLIQDYSADFSQHANLTELMGLDADLRYDRRIEPGLTRQDAIPSLSWSLNNYLFWLNLAATDDEQSYDAPGRGNSSNRTLVANWNSTWQKRPFLPALTANFSKNWQNDAQEPHLQDQEGTGAGGSVDWNLALARVFYSYRQNDTQDAVTGDEYKSKNHQARISTDAAFWQGRGTASVSQQYAYTTNESVSQVQNGVALARANGISSYSAQTQPAIPFALPANGLLTDGNRDATAVAVVNNPTPPVNIGVRINFQQVDRLYLYAVDTSGNPLTASDSGAFTWDLYWSDDNLNWTLSQPLTAYYNPAWKRFEFVLPGLSHDYLKLVARTAPALSTVNLTEIEAYRAVSATGTQALTKDDQTTYQTDANLNLKLRSDLQLTSNVSYQQSNYTLSPDLTNTAVNSGLVWNPAALWTVRLNGNLNTRDRVGLPTDEVRSYGASVGFPLLPTLDSVLGVTRSWYTSGGLSTSTGTTYALQLIAALYTDLSARLNLALDQRDGQGTTPGVDTTTGQILLTSRLKPGLTADWSGLYSSSSAAAGGDYASDARLNWRLTDLMSVRGGLYNSWSDSASSAAYDTSNLYGGLDMALTANMQLALNQRLNISPASGNITSLDWRWTINQYLSMLTSGAFMYGGKRDEWNISSRLHTRLTGF